MSATISPHRLMDAATVIAQLRAEIGDEDMKALLDNIEGATDAMEIIDRLAESALADKALVAAGSDRLKRIEARAERTRAVIQQLLEVMGVSKLERPIATMSVADGPRGVVITDQSIIPDGFWRRSVDKQEIARALKAGTDVAGAELANGVPVLRLHSR